MQYYKVGTPLDGTFTINASSGTQARQEIARRIRSTYPSLSISAIASMLSARLVESKNPNAGRPRIYKGY